MDVDEVVTQPLGHPPGFMGFVAGAAVRITS